MHRPLQLLIAIAAVAACTSAASGQFYALNRFQVVPLNPYEFEVVGRPGGLKPDYWCAIGDFLRRQKVPWRTRIYAMSGIERGVATGARTAVRFTLDPAASGIEVYENSLITDVLTVGYGRDLTSAWGECREVIIPGF